MSEISKFIGQRIRNYRTQQKLSQEKLAELSGCHPTYIGSALNIPLSRLFEKLGDNEQADSIPLKCYEFLSAKTKAEQEHLYRMLIEMDEYKNK